MSKLAQHEIVPLPSDTGALGNRINKQTRSAHNKIDKLMTLKFALAIRDPKIYRQGLQSFYHVFNTIELCLHTQIANNNQYSDILSKIFKPEIARSDSLKKDLLFYYDNDFSKFEKPILSEQIKFVNHIIKATTEKPYLLLAYLHVMYLALFAGGRIMRGSLSKSTRLFPQIPGVSHEEIVKSGTNFFNFNVEDENLLRLIYKRDYEILTRNFLTEDQKLEIIDESSYIFEQNAKCVQEIERHNIKNLTKKWSYIAVVWGYYGLILLISVLFLFYLRRVYLHLF